MGEQRVQLEQNSKERALFIQHLLGDIDALELMLQQGLIESGITRIGAEQEFCLVTSDWRPAQNADEVLKEINDTHFTTELAKYNLEINLDPVILQSGSFQKVENQLKNLLEKANKAAQSYKSKIILTGILPTISRSHLKLDYITNRPRYLALNERLMGLRGSHFHLHLVGVDELSILHDSVLFEACNTSFQLHLQIDPDDFISSFNWAQAITGPVLSIVTNSPMLMGRELWSETRIALFRQSIDTRHISLALKDQMPRVSFGTKWASGSIVDIYRENIAEYKAILSTPIDENSLEMVQQGKIPKLKALNLHNGTIYPWNRACYGVGNGKPHVRIENRYIPSGPSVLDEMANFAFWVGIMKARPKKYDDMTQIMDFRDAKSNFIKAARYGKDAVFCWEGKPIAATKLIEQVFLPMAKKGLTEIGIDKAQIEKYLGVIEGRIKGYDGSQWLVKNFRNLNKEQKPDHSLRLITKTIHKNQKQGIPVHQWKHIKPGKSVEDKDLWVGHVMSTRLLTVAENDLAHLATQIMKWKNIHHMPVENGKGKLSGLLTWRHVENSKLLEDSKLTTVNDIMVKEVFTISSTTPVKEAIAIMKKNAIGCLPVLQKNELVGIITIKDVIEFDHD